MERKRVGNCVSERLTVRGNDSGRGEMEKHYSSTGAKFLYNSSDIQHAWSVLYSEWGQRPVKLLCLLLSVSLSFSCCVCDCVWQILPADQIILPTHWKLVSMDKSCSVMWLCKCQVPIEIGGFWLNCVFSSISVSSRTFCFANVHATFALV